jgi:flavin reductase (DIM6/NTAB) family NADH-FMN oxidoreductase RutF
MNQTEEFRSAMRKWAAGVGVATCMADAEAHGMTVNSFTSVSVDPAMVTVTMAKNTRTLEKTLISGGFGITILASDQQWISDRFAGKQPEKPCRFDGIKTFTMLSEIPFLEGGLAFFECKVIHQFEMPSSVLLVGQVLSVKNGQNKDSLVYMNRKYSRVSNL